MFKNKGFFYLNGIKEISNISFEILINRYTSLLLE